MSKTVATITECKNVQHFTIFTKRRMFDVSLSETVSGFAVDITYINDESESVYLQEHEDSNAMSALEYALEFISKVVTQNPLVENEAISQFFLDGGHKHLTEQDINSVVKKIGLTCSVEQAYIPH